jgi:RNA polymerase sigma-70 factor (ECF subfamily)
VKSGTSNLRADIQVAAVVLDDPSCADIALWTSAQAGDADAFGRLFQRHSTLIYNYCFRRVGDWAAAEDLVSVVFLEAWRRRGSVRPELGRAWLFGIANNVMRNRLRAYRRHRAALGRLGLPGPEPDFAGETDARLDDERFAKQLIADLERLPRRAQEVLLLCDGVGLSYEEAAFALQTPVGTVRSRLFRARERMRELAGVFGHFESNITTSREAL